MKNVFGTNSILPPLNHQKLRHARITSKRPNTKLNLLSSVWMLSSIACSRSGRRSAAGLVGASEPRSGCWPVAPEGLRLGGPGAGGSVVEGFRAKVWSALLSLRCLLDLWSRVSSWGRLEARVEPGFISFSSFFFRFLCSNGCGVVRWMRRVG